MSKFFRCSSKREITKLSFRDRSRFLHFARLNADREIDRERKRRKTEREVDREREREREREK
jgi:hypothetical protein